MKQRDRVKGDRYRPVVTILKMKSGAPTVVEISGKRYTLTHESHMRGHQEVKRKAK